MHDRFEKNAEPIALQKKLDDLASFDPVDLLKSDKKPWLKSTNDADEHSLSFDPLSLEKEDLANKKLKGDDIILKKKLAEDKGDDNTILKKKLAADMGDDNTILKKKLAEGFGDKKEPPSPLDRVLQAANDMLNPGAVVARALEQAHKDAMARQYSQLKKSKEVDSISFDGLYG